MRNKTSAHAALPLLSLIVLLSIQTVFQGGCSGTCDRIKEDREQFWTRKASNTDTHVEMTIPFGVAEQLIAPQIAVMQPVAVQLPNLGNLSAYFGDITVVPQKVTLLPASKAHIGFHLDFDVRRNGRPVFNMFVETEVKPEIDLAASRITIGFTPDVLEKARPGISKDAEKRLSGAIYDQLPTTARFLIPRAAVDSVVASAVRMLIDNFHTKLKDRLLPRLSRMSRVEIALPRIPLTAVSVSATDNDGGRLRLAMTTSLPVREGIAASPEGSTQPASERITLRLSASTAAELVNWAIKQGMVPDRYDDKGKPKEDGALRPGLDWISGDERPMKVYLWDLEKPCMRFTLSAKPAVAVVDEKLEMKAETIKTDDIEASAFTKVGVWFYMLWKDPVNLNKKQASTMKMVVAGKEVAFALKAASLVKDEIVLEIQVSTAP